MPSPVIAYKYRSPGDKDRGIRQMIVENKVWFADIASLNDPFDCDPIGTERSFLNAIKDPEIAMALGLESNSLIQDLAGVRQEVFEEISKDVGILSLAGHPDNILLWSHYGGNHKGVALCRAGNMGNTSGRRDG